METMNTRPNRIRCSSCWHFSDEGTKSCRMCGWDLQGPPSDKAYVFADENGAFGSYVYNDAGDDFVRSMLRMDFDNVNGYDAEGHSIHGRAPIENDPSSFVDGYAPPVEAT